jgi:hypothetical protein
MKTVNKRRGRNAVFNVKASVIDGGYSVVFSFREYNFDLLQS